MQTKSRFIQRLPLPIPLLSFLLLALLLPARSQEYEIISTAEETPSAGDEILGTVGKLEIRVSDLRESLVSLTDAERDALNKDPAALGRYVRALLVQQLVLREAIEAEWDKSAEVAERMRLLREGVVANTWLESIGAPPEGFPSEEELSAAYQSRLESFLQPKSWELAQIFVSSPVSENAEPDPEAEEKVNRLAATLKEDRAAFAKLAATESEESISAANDGEIGWLPEPRIHPSIRTALTGLALGEISDPVRMDDGWHLIKVLDIREARIPTLEQIREPLAAQLRAEKAQMGTETYLSELLREKPIAINELVLSKLVSDRGP